jgi:hypothetical protein
VTDESFTLGPPTKEADFTSACPACGGDIEEGEMIMWSEDYGLWLCEGCADA